MVKLRTFLEGLHLAHGNLEVTPASKVARYALPLKAKFAFVGLKDQCTSNISSNDYIVLLAPLDNNDPKAILEC